MRGQPAELHPSLRARIARGLRGLHRVRGGQRLIGAIAGQADARFRVRNSSGWFEGSLGSFIDRQVYLFGGYEAAMIAAFIAALPQGRRRTALDIGANIGTHSIALAGVFAQVICFEPNTAVFGSLMRNVALNPGLNIVPVNCGLGDVEETRDFFITAHDNQGLGTFVTETQYDAPLAHVGSFPIRRGDNVLAETIGADAPVDAIKIDIQGYEPMALRGLRDTLARHRPAIWMEVGPGTQSLGGSAALAELVPFPVRAMRFVGEAGLVNRVSLRETSPDSVTEGDFLFLPRED